jgi:hypothetical protein
MASFTTPGSQRQTQAQKPRAGQNQGQGDTEIWINVEQKTQVQRPPLQYSAFVNQPTRDYRDYRGSRDVDIDPFDTTTPLPEPVPTPTRTSMSVPKNQSRHDIVRVHDSGVVLQLSEVSSEPAGSKSEPVQSQEQTNISDGWEVVYPDE